METLAKIKSVIIIPIIELLFVLALFIFLWGVVQYIININNKDKKAEGGQHMFWGLVGLAIMLSAFGIINFVWNSVHPDGTTGIQGADIQKPDVVNKGGF